MVPFFGDQAFWGSAVHLRGVGPRPIPIDRLTTKKLVAALEFMQKAEVKAQALEVSQQIMQEDGLEEALKAFHCHLPVADLVAGRPTIWQLAKPTVYSFINEVGSGIADLIMDPVKGAREDGASPSFPFSSPHSSSMHQVTAGWVPFAGVKGAVKGLGKGLGSVVTRPLQGFRMSGYSLWETLHVDSIQAAAIPQPYDRPTSCVVCTLAFHVLLEAHTCSAYCRLEDAGDAKEAEGKAEEKASSSSRPLAGLLCGRPTTHSFTRPSTSQPSLQAREQLLTYGSAVMHVQADWLMAVWCCCADSVALSETSSQEDWQPEELEDDVPAPPPSAFKRSFRFTRARVSGRKSDAAAP